MQIDPPPLWREGAGTARMPAGPRFPSNLTSATPAPSAQEPLIQPAQLPPTVMKVEIKNWHGASPDALRAAHPATYPASHRHVCVFSPTAVASWTWTSEDDVCGICHMALDGCAPGAVGPGDDSPVVWGRVRGPPPPARLHRRPRSSRPCPHPCVWHSARTTST